MAKKQKFEHKKLYSTFTADPDNARVLHMSVTNYTRYPLLLESTVFDLSNGNYASIGKFRLFMVTRRSMANPGESFKFRVELDTPLHEQPANAELYLQFGSRDTGFRWLLSNPEGNEAAYYAEHYPN
jgi:hypothetical protein